MIASTPGVIQSARLFLIPMTPAFLTASLAGEHRQAAELIGLTIPSDWWGKTNLMQRRLAELSDDPSLQPWLLRAIALRDEHRMIGHIGFHTRPGAEYLREISPGGVEFGYTVYPAFRRQGYAYEASNALMAWAHSEHHVSRFVVSISPTNIPSLGVAGKLGFVRIGSHMDIEDGPEDIFELRYTGGNAHEQPR